MESKEKMIERIALSTGQSYEKVEGDMTSLTNLRVSSDEVKDRIEEFKQAVERMHLPKRRKPTNYTKPRNRKKKN